MNSKDRHIIRALQGNGRMSNQDLADKVGLSPSPCLRRLRALEKSGVIRGYNVDVDEKAYGLPVTVFVRVRLEKHTENAVKHFEDRIRKTENVLECHVMTGLSDYLLKVIVEDLASYETTFVTIVVFHDITHFTKLKFNVFSSNSSLQINTVE